VNGGWTYTCPHLLEPEIRRLSAQIGAGKKASSAAEEPKATTSDPEQPPAKTRVLTREIQDQIKLIDQLGPSAVTTDDNSNTQFAILGLWVAQRHGLPVAKALARVEARFRNSQNFDGGWGYTPGNGVGSSTAMTCAGLLGLAVGVGVREKQRAEAQKDDDKDEPPQRGRVKNDPVIRAGLLAL